MVGPGNKDDKDGPGTDFSRLPVGISENARQDHAAMVVSSSTEAASAAWRAVTNCRPDEVKW